MHVRSNNEEFMSGYDTDEIIKSLFQSFIQRYEESLQNKINLILILMVLTFHTMILTKLAYIEGVLI